MNLCKRSIGLSRFCIFPKRNADEDPKIRVSMKDKGKIEKKMKETMFGKGEVVCTEYGEG